MTVKVDDRQNKANSTAAKSVTVMVDDVREPPPAPAAPTVAGIPGSTSSVRVTWDEPANMGPAIEEYDVNYREVGSGPSRWPHFGTDRSTIITGLKAGTRYEVQVRARSDEGTGEWSRWGAGMPNPDVANRVPAFSGGARTLNIVENTPPNTDVGTPIAAIDRDGDTLTYTLEGTDADSFDILSTSDGGQIRTSAELNFEEKSSYSATVRVTDGRGGTDAVGVTIMVTDVDGEAPATPLTPTVTAISSTRLQVSWEEPENTGPPITDYDYRYREASGSWTEVTNTTITRTTETIQGTGGEHVLRRGGAGDERGGHERLVESGYRLNERGRRQQLARVHRGHECHPERERDRAGGHAPLVQPVDGDGRRFGRHADLQPRRP